MNETTQRLDCFVENKPSVLARVIGLISGRGYNIQALNVGPTEDGTVSRMRIDVLGDEKVLNQVILQLRNQVNVIEVTGRRMWRAAYPRPPVGANSCYSRLPKRPRFLV